MTDPRPNILFVYTDQQRYDTLGCNGNDLIKTPNLDRAAGEGVNFSRAYVTFPLCCPSRVATFTGRYNHTNLSWSNPRAMYDRERDFATHLRGAGYRTALIGKNHCYPEERLQEAFDYAPKIASHTGFWTAETEAQERVNKAREGTMQVPMAEDPVEPENNITGQLFQEARDYVQDEDERPFFLWLSIPDPHPPYMVCEPYRSMYDDVDVPPPVGGGEEFEDKPYRQKLVAEWNRRDMEYPGDKILELRRIYWGMVSYIDDQFGKLMDTLQEQGLDEDTIIVFTSDHGDYMGDHGMIRKGPHLYDALTHVPFFVRWPGQIKPRESGAFVENIDLMPTLCDLAGVEFDDSHLHGRSFAPVLRGRADTHREAVFLEHGTPTGESIQPGELSAEQYEKLKDDVGHHLCPTIRTGQTKGVRTGRWKYCITRGDVDQLYDTENDPDEMNNLAGDPQYADICREHRDMILDWLLHTEDTQEQ